MIFFFAPLYSFSFSRHRATHLLQKKTPTRQKGSHVENQSAPRDGHATNQVRCGRQDESKVVVVGGGGRGCVRWEEAARDGSRWTENGLEREGLPLRRPK